MNDRQWFGDVAIAVLIAFPTLAVARPHPAPPPHEQSAVTPLAQKAALAEATTAERRVTLPE